MRYELIRLAQLVFALALMFGAFLAGLGVGWWRWRRDAAESATRRRGEVGEEPLVSAGTFTASVRDDEVVLAPPVFDTSAQETSFQRRKSDLPPVFAAAESVPAAPETAVFPPPPPEVGPAAPTP
jgi:hypothetical protein